MFYEIYDTQTPVLPNKELNIIAGIYEAATEMGTQYMSLRGDFRMKLKELFNDADAMYIHHWLDKNVIVPVLYNIDHKGDPSMGIVPPKEFIEFAQWYARGRKHGFENVFYD